MDAHLPGGRAGIAAIALVLVVAFVAAAFGISPLRDDSAGTRAPVATSHHWRQVVVERPVGGTGAPLRVLVLGASVSHGLGASTPSHDYVSDLRWMLTRETGRPIKITVWSQYHATVQSSVAWRIAGGQQLVITQLITNDFFQNTPLFSYEQSVTALLARIRMTSPRASLLCVGAWESTTAVNHMGVPVLAYDALDQRACVAHGGHFLSPSPIFENAAWRGPKGRPTQFGRGDDYHPNDLGHYHLACAILKRLEDDNVLLRPSQPGLQRAQNPTRPRDTALLAASDLRGPLRGLPSDVQTRVSRFRVEGGTCRSSIVWIRSFALWWSRFPFLISAT